MTTNYFSGEKEEYGAARGKQSSSPEQIDSRYSIAPPWVGLTIRATCPGCGLLSALSYGTACRNWLRKKKRPCGYRLPLDVSELNGPMLRKCEKHTHLPDSDFEGLISIFSSEQEYLDWGVAAAKSGDIYLDPNGDTSGWFNAFLTPSGANKFLPVYSGNQNNCFLVSGIQLPLNPRPHELHPRGNNLSPSMIFACPASGAMLERPNPNHPNTFQLYRSSGEQMPYAEWDPMQGTGFVGDTLVVRK